VPSAEQRAKAAAERARALAMAAGHIVRYAASSDERPRALAAAVAAGRVNVIAPARDSAEKPSVETFRGRLKAAQALRTDYGAKMTKAHTLQDTGVLRLAVGKLVRLENDMLEIYADGAGRLKLDAEELQFYMELVDAIASAYDDLNECSHAVQYYERLLAYDKCAVVRRTNATLEYEYCSGRYFSRTLLMYRHELKRPDLATKTYERAVAKRFNGERVHWWPNEWQVPTLYMQGLRGQPYWGGAAKPPLARALEDNFATIRDEFLTAMAIPELRNVFTQNDHTLITAGTWGELKLFDGKAWGPACARAATRTCALLSSRLELMGKFANSRTHNVNLPKEAGYFKLMPGSRLKPHTGPVNFHLYCHLGLVVPKGPRLRVGDGKPRRWQEGKTLCFDDSFDHEAWHDGTKTRYVLMVTFWHPDLGTPERDPKAPVPPSARAETQRAMA